MDFFESLTLHKLTIKLVSLSEVQNEPNKLSLKEKYNLFFLSWVLWKAQEQLISYLVYIAL